MSAVPLEDSAADVVGKALRGKAQLPEGLARSAGVSLERLRKILDGEPDSEVLRAIAPCLDLDADALESLAAGVAPPDISVPGLEMFTTAFGDIHVNSFLVWEAASGQALLFDTGADADPMLDFLTKHQLKTVGIFLTHSHGDHVFELDRLLEKTGAEAFLGDLEPELDGTTRFAAGRMWEFGHALRVESRLTCGHAAGGVTYVVAGLPRLVAVAGDAIFASSMGGGIVSYADALRTTRQEILTLPPETVIAPGHGPLTTVGREMAGNPFFAHRHAATA